MRSLRARIQSSAGYEFRVWGAFSKGKQAKGARYEKGCKGVLGLRMRGLGLGY